MCREGKKREEAQALVDAKQGELIASLINEELLMQRAKEGGFDSDIDAQINQRFANIMKENNLKTIEELYAAMEKTGINPKDVRENWRKQMVRDLVLQRDLQSKVYWEPSPKQLKGILRKA
jgi:parvulin-like peptidyl-prolyl isomerase